MGWKVPTVFWLAPNSTTTITFWWGSGSDQGAQWAMASPVPGEPDVPLATERVAKQLICEVGQIQENGPPVYTCVSTGSNYQYTVWLTNDGSSGCQFQLEGGGV